MSVNNVTFGSANAYYETKNKRPNKGPELNTPPLFEKPEKKNNTTTGVVIGTAVTLATLFLFRGKIKNSKFYQETLKPLINKAGAQLKNIGNKIKNVWSDTVVPGAKKLFNKVKSWFKGEPAKTATPVEIKKGVHKKSKKAVIKEQVDLAPGQSVKYDKKTDIKQIRRQKKKIIEESLERAEQERFTPADLDAYHKILGTPATKAEREFMAQHNKPATQTLGDVIKDKGIKVETKGGKATLTKAETPVVPKAPTGTVVDKVAQLAQKEEQLVKAEAMVQKFNAPGMERWKKPYEAQVEKLKTEIAKLKA